MSLRALSVVTLVLLSGCVGTRVDYAGADMEIALVDSGTSLAVAVLDQRHLDGEPLSWVGVIRTTMGIPFQVHTASGKPLAEEMRLALMAGLDKCGYRTIPAIAVGAGYEWSSGDSDTSLPKEPVERLLAVDCRAWETDGYFGEVDLVFDLTVRVLDGKKKSIAAVTVQRERSAEYVGTKGYVAACGILFAGVMAEVLAFPEITAALTTGEAAPQEEAISCKACEAILESDWVACPRCGEKVAREGH